MNPEKLLAKYIDPDSKLYSLLLTHSKAVQKKALQIAKNHPQKKLDKKFIKEAALLHDIGIFLTFAPKIDCHGKEPYIKHGILGAEILRKEGYPLHAKVCETHIGAGLTKQEIIEQKLPLPHKDFLPRTPEEEIICLSDLFFSKNPDHPEREESLEKIREEISGYSDFARTRLEKLINKYLK